MMKQGTEWELAETIDTRIRFPPPQKIQILELLGKNYKMIMHKMLKEIKETENVSKL